MLELKHLQLYDDGTLDTVISVLGHEFRYSTEHAYPWRDQTDCRVIINRVYDDEAENMEEELIFTYGDREVALAMELGCDIHEVEESVIGSRYYDAPGAEYMVLGDDEAWECAYEYHLEFLTEDIAGISSDLEPWFDREGYIEHQVEMYGRAMLASYDGVELELAFEYYGYRMA